MQRNATQNRWAASRCRAALLIAACLAFSRSVWAEEGKIWEGLFNYQQKMANIGNAEAQFNLAEMYAQGQGVQADPIQARHWYEAAAAQGYEPARRKLAALDAGEPLVKIAAPAPAPVAPPRPPIPVQPPAPPAQDTASRQELERMERERKQLEQELARSREEMQRLQEENARQEAELKRAEAEKDEARRRLAAKALLEAEMKKLRETPPAFDQ
ncbi:SEL1-like repeat protein [Sulfurivermis fontis]|uniref:SEL1-like repeat protein n=1 Tax=Sulfurivermis fontis TaxID=1972068 RepID=UPI000FDB56FF|nr:SEL1-like repeat protein [Sulfurivermis fontis]